MGVAGLACSLVLLLVSSMRVARRVGRTSADRFWIGVAAMSLQVGAGLTGLSFFGAVTPIGMLVVQVTVTIAVFLVSRPRRDVSAGPAAKGAGLAAPASGAVRRSRRRGWTMLDRVLLVALIGMTLLTGFEQLFLSVSNIDDRNYRASRAAYWLEHQSIFGWDSHNDRQVAFPPGGSMPFFVGVLFTRNETAGLMLQWAAYPLVAAGAYLLLRSMRQTRTVSLLGTVALGFTPIVLLHTRGVQPELWLTLYTLGCAYGAVRSLRRRHAVLSAAMSAAFAVLAVNVRMTALPLLVVALLLPLLQRQRRAKGVGVATCAAVTAVVLSGLLLTLTFNFFRFGHPLGSETFRHIHAAETSATQLRAHVCRAIVVLTEPPYLPDPAAAKDVLSKLLHALGGDVTLPREDRPWPGHFSPEVRRWAENYSVFGLLVIPTLVAATWLAARAALRRRMNGIAAVAMLTVPFFLGVVVLVRWMGVMGRFWIAPYVLVAITATVLIARGAKRHRWINAVACILVALVVIPAAAHRLDLHTDIRRPDSPVALDEPYAEALARTPPGATVLLVAGQGTRDYPLFRPREGFSNHVISWGRHDDANRLYRLLAESRATHVVIENDKTIDFDWNPAVATAPLVAAMAANPAFVEVPMEFSPGMRLFARR